MAWDKGFNFRETPDFMATSIVWMPSGEGPSAAEGVRPCDRCGSWHPVLATAVADARSYVALRCEKAPAIQGQAIQIQSAFPVVRPRYDPSDIPWRVHQAASMPALEAAWVALPEPPRRLTGVLRLPPVIGERVFLDEC